MIERRNHGRGHSYVDRLADGSTVPLPSVTGILRDALPPPLKKWAAREAASYAIDHWAELAELPLLERGELIRTAPDRSVSTAAVRGTEVHALAERLTHGAEVDVPDALAPHVDSALAFLSRWDPRPVITEAVIVNREIGYAGTLDLVADMRGTRWLLDWKTGTGVYPDAVLQLAAYAHAEHYVRDGVERPMAELDISRAGIVHVRADGFDVYPAAIGPDAFLIFRHAAWLARWTHWDRDTRSTALSGLLGRSLQAVGA